MLSYDGGGNDGVFNVFLARGTAILRVGMPVRLPEHADAVTGQDLWRIARKPLNLGISAARVG